MAADTPKTTTNTIADTQTCLKSIAQNTKELTATATSATVNPYKTDLRTASFTRRDRNFFKISSMFCSSFL